jgi:two-component system sensor histidine kinase HydH
MAAMIDGANAPEAVAPILPHLAAGTAVLSSDNRVSSWSALAEDLTGYSLPQIQAIGLAQIFEPVEVMQHILRKAQAGLSTLGEYLTLRRADGQRVGVAVQCSPQRHLDGSACHIVVAFRELASLQQQLRRDEHLALLGRLASSLSHEIRNPLNAIFLHTDILEEEWRQPGPDSRTQVQQSLTTIKTEITRIDDLVQQYLSLARLAAVQLEPEDLGAFVQAFGREIKERLAARHITLTLHGLEDLGRVALHPSTFRRLLLNLVENALEAMPQGGTLTLAGRREDSSVKLMVSDTGDGIPPEQLHLLFTPFHTTKPEGTGLGLYVGQEIMAAHGGTMDVVSEPGHSTTFTLTLPLTMPDTTVSE